MQKRTFRCWNEPDIGYWHNHDLPEYLKLYDFFAKGVKSVSPDIRIGGPALTSTGTYRKPDNFRFFLDHVAKGTNHATGEVGSPIDYLAVHTYGGGGSGGGPGRAYPEVDYLIEQQIRYADMRDEYPELRNLPIHVEEWGVSSGGTIGISERPMADFRNSQFGAAFLTSWVERHIRMRQENDRKIESFTFCSSGYERMRTRDFMGYRTLDTKHDRIDSKGPSYPVTLNIDTPWKPGTKVTLNHWRIDQHHGNAYTVFKEIGSPELPNPLEIDQVKRRMDIELLEPTKRITVKDLVNVEFELPCNAVSLIEIIIN